MKNRAGRRVMQVPEGYLLVGVDPHKKTHAAVAITRDYIYRSRLKFSNSREGFEKAVEWARGEMVRNGSRGIMFAIETASHYWRNLAYYLEERGIIFRQVNQFTLKRRREGKDNNKRKSDFRDAETAAQLLCSGEFSDGKLLHGEYAELRAAYSAYCRLREERTRLINRIKGLLDGIFPEFTQAFRSVIGSTALTVLETCPVPRAIVAMTEEQFILLTREKHLGRLMKGKLAKLHSLAGSSAGIKEGAGSVALELSLMIKELRVLRCQIEAWEERLKSLVDQTKEGKYLLSISGVSYITVAGWLAQTGPFSNYQDAKQFIKLAGSNPTESESAGKSSSRTPMSKKGRSGFRCCLWTAAISLLQHNPEFRGWAAGLRERPAHAHPLNKREVIGAASNRLARVGFALVRDQTYYLVPERVAVR